MNNFQILKKLGEGSFSTVFQARRKSDNIIYALKKVKMGKLSQKEKSSALNEIRILASIDHENIVSLKESFFDDTEMCLILVMDYCDAGDLLGKIDKCKKMRTTISEDTVWSYFFQMICGLKLMHDMKICHRDIKGANLFLTSTGCVKLGDLNVSSVVKQGMLKTQTGTPYYASPEIWQDRPYDYRSDIWSIGCVLYEMCALKPPFTASDMNGLFKAITSGRVPSLTTPYSKDLNSIVQKCLQQTPKLRPTAQALYDQIKKLKPDLVANYEGALGTASSGISKTASTGDLLRTIKMPASLFQINQRLPGANYEQGTPEQQGPKKLGMGRAASLQNLKNIEPKQTPIAQENKSKFQPSVQLESVQEQPKRENRVGSAALRRTRGNAEIAKEMRPAVPDNKMKSPAMKPLLAKAYGLGGKENQQLPPMLPRQISTPGNALPPLHRQMNHRPSAPVNQYDNRPYDRPLQNNGAAIMGSRPPVAPPRVATHVAQGGYNGQNGQQNKADAYMNKREDMIQKYKDQYHQMQDKQNREAQQPNSARGPPQKEVFRVGSGLGSKQYNVGNRYEVPNSQFQQQSGIPGMPLSSAIGGAPRGMSNQGSRDRLAIPNSDRGHYRREPSREGLLQHANGGAVGQNKYLRQYL